MKRSFRLDMLLIVIVPLIDSLGVTVAQAAENGNFAGSVDIGGGRKMYLKCSGRGSPTAVLVGGLRASVDDWDISDKSKPTVFTGLQNSRACVSAIALEPRLVTSQAAATPSRSRPPRRMLLPICTPC